VFYITKSDEGSVGYVESTRGSNRMQVWSSPMTHVTASWDSPNSIIIYTNPSLVAPGVVWSLDPRDWSTDVLLSNQNALSARLNPSGNLLLYSMQEENGGVYTLRVLNLETQDIIYLPLPTLAEKCVWGHLHDDYVYCAVPRNMNVKDYMEEWYKGRIDSDDVLWRFDTHTGTAKKILDPSEATRAQFDMIDLGVDQTDMYLLFRTKQAHTLWAVELPQDLGNASGTAPVL